MQTYYTDFSLKPKMMNFQNQSQWNLISLHILNFLSAKLIHSLPHFPGSNMEYQGWFQRAREWLHKNGKKAKKQLIFVLPFHYIYTYMEIQSQISFQGFL